MMTNEKLLHETARRLMVTKTQMDLARECLRIAAWNVSQARAAWSAENDRLRDALAWCSGSADFGEGGIARIGWLKGPSSALAAGPPATPELSLPPDGWGGTLIAEGGEADVPVAVAGRSGC